MRTSQATKYARWAATAAIGLTVLVAGVYLYRAWQAREAARDAPPPVPVAVQQRSEEFSFSKVEGDRTLFTVRASRATEFKEGGKSLLQDVWITIYGRGGRRFDNLHTAQCDYLPDPGRVVCGGEVQIDLESAEEAKMQPGARTIRIATSNVSFDRETGEVRTDQPVEFRFPYGRGRGTGVTYSTREAAARILRDVEITLQAAEGAHGTAVQREPLTLTASGLVYERNTQTMRLLPPLHSSQGRRELTAGALALVFDSRLRAQRLVAQERPQLELDERGARITVAADEIVISFAKQAVAERIVATGNVRGERKAATGESRLSAARLEMEMTPDGNAPRLAVASGGAKLDSSERGVRTSLETDSLRFTFVADATGAQLARAETASAAMVERQEGGDLTRLRAQRFAADFGARSHVRRLEGAGGVEVERRFTNRPAQETAAEEFSAEFDASGDWTELDLRGNVRFRDGERTAEAQKAKILRTSELLVLGGSATVADATARTTAESISFHQRTGDLRADGTVRTTYHAPRSSSDAPAGVPNLGASPAHLSADHLRANRDSGRAVYSGRARLWQGDAMIEAETVELERDTQRLNARDGVLALLPQAKTRLQPATGAVPPRASNGSENSPWRVRAASLAYLGTEGKVHLEGNVTVESSAGRIQCPRMDLFLANTASGVRQLVRAEGTGGVVVRQSQRRGTAERGVYVVAEGKFVLSGGQPTIYDDVLGTTTGRQLTFFLADDRILVESEEGSRTVTRHRVDK